MVAVDSRTLRVQFRRGGRVANADIAYDAAQDLYDVTVTTFAWPAPEETQTLYYAGIYAEDLPALLASVRPQ
jgi:hypothetical protein